MVASVLKIACTACGKGLTVRAELAGKRCRCPHCRQPVLIAASADPAKPAPSKRTVECPRCQASLKVAVTQSAKKVKCPKCTGAFTVQPEEAAAKIGVPAKASAPRKAASFEPKKPRAKSVAEPPSNPAAANEEASSSIIQQAEPPSRRGVYTNISPSQTPPAKSAPARRADDGDRKPIVKWVLGISAAAVVGFGLFWLAAAIFSPSTATVRGAVTYKGAKVPSGTVVFLPANGASVEAEIQDGFYEVKGVSPGDAVVTVSSLDPTVPSALDLVAEIRKAAKEKNITDEEELRKLDPEGVLTREGFERMQRKRNRVPPFYSDASRSDLRFTVVSGTSTFDIELLDKR